MRIYIDTSVVNGLYAEDARWIKETTKNFFTVRVKIIILCMLLTSSLLKFKELLIYIGAKNSLIPLKNTDLKRFLLQMNLKNLPRFILKMI